MPLHIQFYNIIIAEGTMVVWREAEVNYLIDLIKSHDFIWNTSSSDYKDKHKKFKFWGFAAYKINTAYNPTLAFERSMYSCFLLLYYNISIPKFISL